MININSVYTTVLTVLDKERRGDLPPDRFNDLASLVQLEIFSKTLYDRAHFKVSRKSDMAIMELLDEQIEIFRSKATLTSVNGSDGVRIPNRFNLPTDVYRLDSIEYAHDRNTYTAENIKVDKLRYIQGSDKAMMTPRTPKYVRFDFNCIEMFTGETDITASNVSTWYIKQPTTPIWGYISRGDGSAPVHRPVGTPGSTTVNFQLHSSLEDDVVKRILVYAGLSISQIEVATSAGTLVATDDQSEKS